MRVSARCSQRSLRSLRMVCAETSKRLARSSTITRPEARARLRISVWRWESPAMAAPYDEERPRVAAVPTIGQRGRLVNDGAQSMQQRRSTNESIAAKLTQHNQKSTEETMSINRREL